MMTDQVRGLFLPCAWYVVTTSGEVVKVAQGRSRLVGHTPVKGGWPDDGSPDDGTRVVGYPGTIAAADPQRRAVVMGRSGEVVTYGQLNDGSIRLARLLREHGIATPETISPF